MYKRAGNVLGIIVPDGWPNDADAQAGLPIHLRAMQENPTERFWRIRLMVLRQILAAMMDIDKRPPRSSGLRSVSMA
jgi:hypothetical protein